MYFPYFEGLEVNTPHAVSLWVIDLETPHSFTAQQMYKSPQFLFKVPKMNAFDAFWGYIDKEFSFPDPVWCR